MLSYSTVPQLSNFHLKTCSIDPPTIPQLDIKSPGTIFEKNKGTPFSHQTFKQLSEIIQQNYLSSCSFPDHLEKSFKTHFSGLVLIAEKILLDYDIHLFIKIEDNFKDALFVLDCLLAEIFTFPRNFLKKLCVKSIFLYGDLNDFSMGNHRVGQEERAFVSTSFVTSEQIIKKFHSILFSCWIEADRDLLEKWNAMRNEAELRMRSVSVKNDLEQAFYSTIGSEKYTILKATVRKVRQLLIQFEPLGITNEWFEHRINKKCKKIHVSFKDLPSGSESRSKRPKNMKNKDMLLYYLTKCGLK